MNLPQGWQTVAVADVAAAMFDGPFGSALKTSDYTDHGVRVARLENIGHLRFRGELESFVSQEKVDSLRRHLLAAHDVLFSSFVDQETRVCLVPDALDGRMINKADCFCVRTDRAICDPRFLVYKLAAPSSYDSFSGSVRGITRPRIGLRDLAAFKIDLPPLAEQRRIVAKLDALFGRLAQARVEVKRAMESTRRLRGAILSSAYERALATGGRLVNLRKYCVSITDGDHQAPPRSEVGVPFITISAINKGRINLSKVTRFVPPEYAESLNHSRRAQPGDVLYSVTGSFGIPALVRDNLPFVFQRHIALLRPDPNRCEPAWLAHMMAAPQILDQARAIATGTAQLTVSLSGLRELQLPEVPVGKQRAMANDIDRALAYAERVEAEATRAEALLDRLEAAILTKAFKGELVPQDPNDEPASVLLQRIKAARAGELQSQPKRGRKATAPKIRRYGDTAPNSDGPGVTVGENNSPN